MLVYILRQLLVNSIINVKKSNLRGTCEWNQRKDTVDGQRMKWQECIAKMSVGLRLLSTFCWYLIHRPFTSLSLLYLATVNLLYILKSVLLYNACLSYQLVLLNFQGQLSYVIRGWPLNIIRLHVKAMLHVNIYVNQTFLVTLQKLLELWRAQTWPRAR